MEQESSLSPIKKRRVRYRGTHPRHFEEKYKELQGEHYSADVNKVLERGQTPAGTHRPICVKEILTVLDPKPGMTGLDATLGYGGHSQEILRLIVPNGKLFGIDVDPIELPRTEARLRKLGFTEENLAVRRMNFAGLPQLLPEAGGEFDFVLADLGVSSMQIDTPSRGFSFKIDGPLDLRLNPLRGQPVSTLLKTLSIESLTDIFVNNSDEPHSKIIAHAIFQTRNDICTTNQLANVIKDVLSAPRKNIPADDIKKSQQRVFQALRILVNDEFTVLDQFLSLLPACLKPHGRVAILTFHSGEDRRVKKSFLHGFRTGIYKEIAREPIRPTPQERRTNPRSTCAKLRWAEKAIAM
jgi:16S rRNA (cytosine1402-N4)-methyltransferase